MIGMVGGRAIAEALESNRTLRVLNLYKTKLGPEVAASLAASLRKNNTLHDLDLNENDIGEVGGKVLAGALRINTGESEEGVWVASRGETSGQ